MKKQFLIYIFLLASALYTKANPLFIKANKAYQKGQFKEAITSYNKIISQGNYSAPLYFNLGNAYYKTGNMASAILYYEKALKIEPNNEDILFNLNYCNKLTTDKIETLPQIFYVQWWNHFCSIFNLNMWSIIIILCACLFCISLGLYLYISAYSLKKTFFFIALSFLFLIIISFFASYHVHNKTNNQSEAIIYAYTLNVKASPDINSNTLFVIHEGLKVTIIDRIGDWYEIKIPNGDKGWIQKNNLQII